jgi:hypothetical protein
MIKQFFPVTFRCLFRSQSLKKNNFQIVPGVESVDVLAFADWIESFE